jgi:large repetitive protein
MNKKYFVIIGILFFLSLYIAPAYAQLPQISSGLGYLSSSQNPDGTWQTDTTSVETTAATVTVLETLKLLNQTAGTTYTTGTAWLQAQSPQSVDYIAERLHLLALTDARALIPSADATGGGWGGDAGYTTNFLDTALSLQALNAANYTDSTIINPALTLLTASQNPDGGWGFYKGDGSNVYMSALVSATLQQFPQMSPIATAVGKASGFLLAHQNPDGGFGSSPSTVYETALAFEALAAVYTGSTVLGNAVNYLTTTQAANGSWDDDPYATALALKALYLSENRPSPPPPPPAAGAFTGMVVDAITNQRIAGVSVALESNNLINTVTDAAGNFTLNDVPPGSQKVNFTLAGYAATSASATATANVTTSLGNVAMVSAYSTGTIAGTISDDAGKPLAGVAITVTGAWNGGATTGADGSFSIAYVTPGAVTIAAAKAGYQDVTAQGTVYARTTLTFSPRLSTNSSTATTGMVVGRVIDSYWGLPIGHLPEEQGVTIRISGGTTVTPDDRGYFSIPNLSPNTYQVTVGMDGFASQTFRAVIIAGSTTDLGTIRLDASFSMTLTGTVTDASTGAPIPGAGVTVTGKSLTGWTDFAGTYVITDIPHPGQYTVKATATDYIGKTFTVGSSPWTHTMNIALVPLATKGSLTGTVIDASSNQPLPGVALTLVSDPSIAVTTDSSGVFIFSSVPKGPQEVTLSLSSYTSRTLSTPIIPGASNSVGTIPLSVLPMPASIHGTVRDAVANAPFAGVDIQTSGTDSRLSVTAGDGAYKLDNVNPGMVTVEATAVTKAGYYPARFTGQLEEGGIMVFSPILSTAPPATVKVIVQTDRTSYIRGDAVGLSIDLLNTASTAYGASLHVFATDPTGANVYETNVDVSLAADGAFSHNLSFNLPDTATAGNYKVLADLYDVGGTLLGRGTRSFGVATSQITVTPTLPAAFAEGDNGVSFSLTNTGNIAVSTGTFNVTMTDPDGQVVSTASQAFTLGVGESKSLAVTLSIPALKFGTYTLSYLESDETTEGQTVEIPVVNDVSVAAVFDKASYRIRETAKMTVALSDSGRFNLDTSEGVAVGVTVSVPDAGYSETKSVIPALAVGSAGSELLYSFALPETLVAGQHSVAITVTLPSGSSTVTRTYFAIPDSLLSLSSVQSAYNAGDTIQPVIANSGGVDTQVRYRLSLYDEKSAQIAEKSDIGTVIADSSLVLSLPIPDGAVNGPYSLVVVYRDEKTGKEVNVTNPLSITGIKGSLQVMTDKENYLSTENVWGLGAVTNSGAVPINNENLHLQVVTGAGYLEQKTWTTQADFQTGVRSGVDTYGVNDWITPDDDFSGAAVNRNRWGINAVSGGVIPTIVGEQLQLDTTSITNSASWVTANFSIDGDFDIQVDYEINRFTNQFSHALLIASPEDGGEFRVGRAGNYYQSYRNPPLTNYVTSSSDTKGKLRLTRTGDVAKSWYWNGSQWVNHYTWTVSTAPVRFTLDVTNWIGTEQLHVKFDNFTVNSGRIKTVKQTVDSVRLLPLSDNFDDGILNRDRWNLWGKSDENESLGFFHLTSNAASVWHGITLKVPLKGNFSAVSKYKNFSASPTHIDWGAYQMLGTDGPSGFYIVRHSNSQTYYQPGGQTIRGTSFVNGENYYFGTNIIPYPSDAGAFQLRKDGTTGYTDFWDGSKWVNIYSESRMSTEPITIKLYTLTDTNDPTIKADLDDFYTNSATYSDVGTLNLKHDSGRENTTWGRILFNSTQPLGTSIKFRTRTSDTESGLAAAIWSDSITASGSAITSPAARWIEVEATLLTTDTNVTPLLHDLTASYEVDAGQVLWQSDTPVSITQGATTDFNKLIGTLGVTGKLYLQGTVTSSTGQKVAFAEYPFYIEEGNTPVTLGTDRKIYKPGETVTVSGKVKNNGTVEAVDLTLTVKRGTGETLYSETFTVPAGGSHPYVLDTTAEGSGIVALIATVTQNNATLAEISDQYMIASPNVTATFTAPDTAGIDPFAVTLSLTNSSTIDASTNVQITDDSGQVIDSQTVAIPAGETRMLQYTRQISAATTYTAAMSGDLNQTLTKTVAYATTMLPSGGVTAKVFTDKVSYNPHEQATLTVTLTAAVAQENLSARIAVFNGQGQAVFSATAAISTLIQGQTLTFTKYWNVGTNPAGTYLVNVQLIDASGIGISTATCNLVINAATNPKALLNGQISVAKQSLLTGEPVAVSYDVTNTGNLDLSNVALTVRTVNLAEETVYNTITDQEALLMGATHSGSGSIDTTGYTAKDYLVVLQAAINGIEETLAGTYFRVEGAPSAPALFGPANGSDIETFTPALVVSNAADPNDDKLSYEFEIYTDSGLTTLVASGTVPETAGTTGWTVSTSLAENRTYFWRARAYDGILYGPWMAPASFRVNTANDPPMAPTVASPASGTTVAVLTPPLTVNNASDPDSTNLTYNFDVALDSDFTQILASTKGIAGGQGMTSWTVPVPLQENGWYYWRAQADDWFDVGPWSTTAQFFVNTANDPPTTPVITAPLNGATVTTLAPDIVAANSTDPDSPTLTYSFELDTVPTFDSAYIIRSGPVAEGESRTLWHVSGLSDNTWYYLRVKASDGIADSPWSIMASFFANTVNDPPATPMLANPSNGAGVNNFTPTLSVFDATDKDHNMLTYEFELYANAAMTDLVARMDNVTETAQITSWEVPVSLTENKTYFWRSRVYDGQLHSGWMPEASFMVNTANDAPEAPGLSSPLNGSSLASFKPTLSVVNAVDPDSDSLAYEFEVYSGGSLVEASGSIQEDPSGVTSWISASPLTDNTDYQWRARAYDGDRYGSWMAMANFTVHIPVTAINATIDFDPDTLNKSSKGTWVVVYIELPAGYKPADIDISSIRLEGTIPAEIHPSAVGDNNNNGVPDLMVKFKRQDVVNLLSDGEQVPVHVTGKVGNTSFDGVDVIRVIH